MKDEKWLIRSFVTAARKLDTTAATPAFCPTYELAFRIGPTAVYRPIKLTIPRPEKTEPNPTTAEEPARQGKEETDQESVAEFTYDQLYQIKEFRNDILMGRNFAGHTHNRGHFKLGLQLSGVLAPPAGHFARQFHDDGQFWFFPEAPTFDYLKSQFRVDRDEVKAKIRCCAVVAKNWTLATASFGKSWNGKDLKVTAMRKAEGEEWSGWLLCLDRDWDLRESFFYGWPNYTDADVCEVVVKQDGKVRTLKVNCYKIDDNQLEARRITEEEHSNKNAQR